MGNTVRVHLPSEPSGPPTGGTYHDFREHVRGHWRRIAAESRRQAWAERHAAMIAAPRSRP
jgi:hypothetical protein